MCVVAFHVCFIPPQRSPKFHNFLPVAFSTTTLRAIQGAIGFLAVPARIFSNTVQEPSAEKETAPRQGLFTHHPRHRQPEAS
jgi:hypothetical protein